MLEKKTFSAAEIEAQAAFELPDREMMALINIVIIDAVDLSQVSVQVPIGVAANVCGVQANVLAQDTDQTVDCTSATTQDLPVRFQ
jgi:hypothetical protein